MSSPREKTILRVTAVGSVVNLLLTAMKFVAGIMGRSSAMVADAVHSLSDLVSDVIILVFVHISGKPSDEDHDYGHGKYETLASLITGLTLCLVGLGMAAGGIRNIVDFARGHTLADPTWLALGAAVVSIVVKEALYQYTARFGRVMDSTALTANAWHHRSDALTSVAALVGIGGAMLLGPGWRVLDPIAAVVVSGFIIKAAVDIMRPAFGELMEQSLNSVDKRRIEAIVLSTPGVTRFHRLRTRRIGSSVSIDLHLKMPGDLSLTDAHNIATEVETRLRVAFGPTAYVNIHMEPA